MSVGATSKSFVVRTAKECSQIGQFLGNQMRKRSGSVVMLLGEVGVGKSEFARGLIRSVTKQKDLVVTSPTFILCNSYPCKSGRNIHHLDLHRLRDVHETDFLNLNTLLDRGDDLVIEWPELLLSNPWPRVEVRLSVVPTDPTRRTLQLSTSSPQLQPMIEAVDSAVRSVT